MPCPGCLGRVPGDRPGSCGQHLQGNTHHGDFLEARVPTRSGLPDNAHWQQGPWKSNGGWGWCPPTRVSQTHRSWELHGWTERLDPSTINKVHHERRLKRPLAHGRRGREATAISLRLAGHLQPGCRLLRPSPLLYFLRTVEL